MDVPGEALVLGCVGSLRKVFFSLLLLIMVALSHSNSLPLRNLEREALSWNLSLKKVI